ncbi:hypothetical protein [Nocardioides sp.]|uniref:hypothetical protein n=1 Tax=Nocardioides sp. TaxID=35761 RepID=UPI0026301DD3|nr:hypothetical protein [Nocardioides sp.]
MPLEGYVATASGDEQRYWRMRRQVSVARCARVSYLTHDGRRDVEADLGLYARLVEARPPHWSPLEHVARVAIPGESTANLRGWTALRQVLDTSTGAPL